MELTLLSEDKQREAAINWLRQQPGSLLILDNIDAEAAATVVEALAPQLTGDGTVEKSSLAGTQNS
jgi:hypothetical protein